MALTVAATPASLERPGQPVTLKPVLVPGGIGEYKWRDRRLIDALTAEDSIPLILDAGDELLEAGQMNVWIMEGPRILTPPADGRLLPGVTRALVLELAPTLGLEPVDGGDHARAGALRGLDLRHLLDPPRVGSGPRSVVPDRRRTTRPWQGSWRRSDGVEWS